MNTIPVKNKTTISEQDDETSRCLVDARLNARPLPEFPGPLPDSLEQAYAIQSASIERWPDKVAGWKVAKLPPNDRSRFTDERLAGPIFKSSINSVKNGSCLTVPVFEGGFAAVEAEIVLELGVAVPPSQRDYSDDELAGLLSSVYCGAEIASSPMALVNDLGATSTASDFGSNAGIVVGPEIADWRSRLGDPMPATVTVDDVEVGHADAVTIAEIPLQALRFLINLSASRGIDLPAGTLISSGALTGVHKVQLSSAARVEYGVFGWFDLKFEPMAPKVIRPQPGKIAG